MTNTWDKCKNCGGEYGLHHALTDQCPIGGREAPVGRKQEWKTTTFVLDEGNNKDDKIAALTARVAELEAMVTKQAYAASTMLNIFDRGLSPNTAGRRACDNLREATVKAAEVLEAK